MKWFRPIAVAIAALLAVSAEDRLNAGKPQPNIRLRVDFDDSATHNMQSDSQGPYQDGKDRVVAYINPAANSALTFGTDTNGTGGRKLTFLFGSCLPEFGDCEAPFTSGLAPAGILAAPRNAAGGPVTNGLLGMNDGETLRAFYQIQVQGQPDEWTLCMKPENVAFCANSPNGTWGRVTRLRSDAWEFFASSEPDAWGRSDVADLLRTAVVNRKKTITLEGTYSLPFRFTATICTTTTCP